MRVKRVKFIVDIDCDPVMGTFHTPQDVEAYLSRFLKQSIPHYRPTVEQLDVYTDDTTLPPARG